MSANLVAPTVAWESRNKPRHVPVIGAVVALAGGGWAIDTDPGATPDGYMIADPDGGVMVDDAAASGLNVRVVGRVPVAY